MLLKINFILHVFPFLIGFLIFFLGLRLISSIKKKNFKEVKKEIIFLITLIYILASFEVLTLTGASWTTSNLILLNEITRYDFGTFMFFKTVGGNILLFLPFGFLICYYLNIKKFSVLVIFAFLFSLSIELLQHMIGRVFDVDDILLNVIGAIIGFLIYKLYRKKGRKK